MSNPFGDFEEEEKVASSGRVSANTHHHHHQSTAGNNSGVNPFGDFEDETDSPPARPRPNISSHKKTPLRHSNLLGTLEPSLSTSRQSISSTDLETLSFTSSTSGIGHQWSVGDGQLEKEGLLCPNCLVEFKTITELMHHSEKCFATVGNASSAAVGLGTSPNSASDIPGQMGVQIKDFFNKIRKSGRPAGPMTMASRVETQEQNMLEQKADEDLPESVFDPFKEWKHQMKIGPRRSHMEGFRKIRETRIERYVYETNKLLIRLDKLLRDYPPLNDPVKRREHEQSVVNWIDESIVSLCPTCASKFNILTRKKHHCRLCGAVMCTKCSEFIDFEYARQLITPVGLDGQKLQPQQLITPSKPRSSSINSISLGSSPNIGRMLLSAVSSGAVDAAETADRIRVCLNCMGLLANRKEKLEIAYTKPPIVQLYAELKEKLNEIERLLPIMLKMSESLNLGETTYSLADANDLKKKLTRLGETSDLMSRKIEALGFTKGTPTADDPKPAPIPPPTRQYNLQLAIRRSTIAFIRNALLGLPELPDDKQFAELKARNDEMIKQRIAYEKELVLKEQQLYRERGERSVIGSTDLFDKYSNYKAASSALSKSLTGKSELSLHSTAVISLDDGFCPQTSSTDLWRQMNEEERAQILDESTDPLAQQISIIRTYIRTARDNHRYEEVAMLEENLKELEIEYYFKQQQQPQSQSHSQPTSNSFKKSPTNSTHNLPSTESNNPFGNLEEDT